MRDTSETSGACGRRPVSSLVLLIKTTLYSILRSKKGLYFLSDVQTGWWFLTKPPPVITENLCKPKQAGMSFTSVKTCELFRSYRSSWGKPGCFLNGSLSLKGRHHLFDRCSHPVAINSLSSVPAFLFHWRCSAGLLWPWGQNFNVFQLSPSYISLSLIHIQVPTQDSPMLWYSTNPNRFGFCFAFYSWIHPVNVNMENKYIPMLLQYFEDQLAILSPLKEGCFYTYQCKMQIKTVIIRMQFKGYGFSTVHLFILNEN